MIEEVKVIMEYTGDEINTLGYKLAIKYDKRTYCQYYFSLIKTSHDFISSFFYNGDYNSKIIKIDLFFINFTTFSVMLYFLTMKQCIKYMKHKVHLI